MVSKRTVAAAKKAPYLIRQARRRLIAPAGCPDCGNEQYNTVDRKALLIELRRCSSCRLMYRFPADTKQYNERFYQSDYAQGFTTDLPSDEGLAELKKSSFSGTPKDYSRVVSLLNLLDVPQNARIFDFGCSWGYGSWQLARAGYNITTYEISVPRARFAAEKLSVNCLSDIDTYIDDDQNSEKFDVFFSSHVIEHVPKPSDSIEKARKILKDGGLFIAFTPNGSHSFREKAPRSWHLMWGEVHPNLIADEFWRACLASDPFVLTSQRQDADPGDPEAVSRWASNGGQLSLTLDKGELLCIARLQSLD